MVKLDVTHPCSSTIQMNKNVHTERERLLREVAAATRLHPEFLRIIGCKAGALLRDEAKQNVMALRAMARMADGLATPGTPTEKLERFSSAFAELERLVGDWKVTGPIRGQMLADYLDAVNPALAAAKRGDAAAGYTAEQADAVMQRLYQMDAAGAAIGRYLNLGEFAKGTRDRGPNALAPEVAEAAVKAGLKHARIRGMWKTAARMAVLGKSTITDDMKAAYEQYQQSLHYLADDYKKALDQLGSLRKQDWDGNWVAAKGGIGAYGSGGGEGETAKDSTNTEKPIHASLQDAVENVYKRIAAEGRTDIIDILTRPELAAIVAYTSQLFSNTNTGLRVGGGVTSTTMQRWTALAVSGLRKLPPLSGQSYRHDGINPFTIARLRGQGFSDLGFFSTAKMIEGTVGAADHDMLSALNYSRGYNVAPLSYYGAAEGEVLFPPNTRWRVDKIYRRIDFEYDERGNRLAAPVKVSTSFTVHNCGTSYHWKPALPFALEKLMKNSKHPNREKVKVIVVATQT